MLAAEIASGATVGLVVGLTGVGGGALMTPVLILFFGVPPTTAIGTDLWFAVFTKLFAVGVFHRRQVVDWALVRLLCIGSVPTAILTSVALLRLVQSSRSSAWLRESIALAVCLSGSVMLLQLRRWSSLPVPCASPTGRPSLAPAVLLGTVISLITTLTSIGAGVLGTVCLVRFYSDRLDTRRVIGTDTAHAVLLSFVAGSGQLFLRNVDFSLLFHLLLGSIPAAVLGSVLTVSIPQRLLRGILSVLLVLVGVWML